MDFQVNYAALDAAADINTGAKQPAELLEILSRRRISCVSPGRLHAEHDAGSALQELAGPEGSKDVLRRTSSAVNSGSQLPVDLVVQFSSGLLRA